MLSVSISPLTVQAESVLVGRMVKKEWRKCGKVSINCSPSTPATVAETQRVDNLIEHQFY